ncbi:TetR/AcrR family transcriptional regulator [Nodosilinea sp. LEGE 06152]|uniref:TetR/AcrR family transcriptional regulator n=1 Tax=Nodosilinea sp. LEGE 06152 TaxID=2777966 RepID=UPI001881989F|nr:TetR/AcrR family transcriptional regulator [Nodosilinea sp. LEGE 06152]MBE9155600.1 TetR/AcrR family transcriptional regulator [Nodosilinea sp. LEGE 06152]
MPKIVDHDQYRKELLNQCFDLFAEKGYAALTMRQIAQGLGVSTGTLYHYFPSKEGLFEQLVRETTLQDIQNAIAAGQHECVLGRIEAALEFVAQNEDFLRKKMLIWIEFYQHQHRESGAPVEVFHDVWQESKQQIAALLGLDDPQLMGFLCCAVDGILLHRIYEPQSCSFRDRARLLVDMVKLYLLDRGSLPSLNS